MLENEILLLRAVEPEDLELLYVWENIPNLWHVGNTRQPYSRFAIKQYIEQADSTIFDSGQLRLMIVLKVSDVAIGTVDLFDFDVYHSRLALGLFIDANFQGKGYATQTLRLVEDYVFHFLKINQLYCHIAADNLASRAMFEKERYEMHGTLKNWINTPSGFRDILVFQRFNTTK
ncbi:MAG: GNAT family N-acetyltransferase [Porphyromonadaceae bacterium CG2_30_38_12]|nr:MAG: GNAT family N-acetyltransferase [Porphyromonadaceae bacterium CG2_30_38_12]